MQRVMLGVLDLEQELQDDHRKARDGVFELLNAVERQDARQARQIVDVIDQVSGPHWRWEEEALYPPLRQFTDELVDGLLKEHDDFIAAVAELSSRLNKKRPAQEDWDKAKELIRTLLYHLATCDGLILWTEILADEEKPAIKQGIFVARRDNLPLLQWAQKKRERAYPSHSA